MKQNARITTDGMKPSAKMTTEQKVVVIVVIITAFVTTFTGSALNLSIPDIGEEFGVSANFVGWLVTGYTLAVAAFSVPIGRLADITCRKTVLVTGLIIFVACCIAAVFSMSMAMLLFVRIVQGIGAAMIFSTNTAILIGAFPGNMRGRVLGYSLASTYVGLSAGPVAGGFLNHNLGWKSIFILTGVLGALAFFIALFKLPKERESDQAGQAQREVQAFWADRAEAQDVAAELADPGRVIVDPGRMAKLAGSTESARAAKSDETVEPVRTVKSDESVEPAKRSMDLWGNALYVVSIVLLMYGLSEIGSGFFAVGLAAAGVLIGILFIRHEWKAEDPAVKVTMFKNNIGYAFSNLSALLNYGATFAISYLISIYLQVVMGYSSQAAGLIMIFQPVIMAVLSPVSGRLSDRVSPFKLSSAGMAFCAAGTTIFIFIGQDTGLVMIIIALIITGLGFSLFSSPNTNAVMSFVDKDDYGVASSILATMRSIGHTLSMVIVTIVVSRFMADVPLAEAEPEILVRVIRISFIVFTSICAAGVFISLKRK